MIKHLRIVFSLSLLLFLAGCASQPGRYQVDMVSDLIMMFPGADHKETQIQLSYTMIEKDEQGNLLVDVTIDSLKASMKSLAVKLSYDSATDTGPVKNENAKIQNRQEKYRQSFTGLQGETYRVRLDLKNETVTLLELPPRLKKVTSGQVRGMFGGDQISMILSKSCLKDYATAGLFEDLDKEWFLHGGTEVPGVASVKTLRKVSGEKKGSDPNQPNAVTVSFDIEKIADQKKPTKKSGMHLTTFEGAGQILRHKGKGPILHWEEKTTANVQTSAKPRARSAAKKKNKRKIYYLITRTIQHIKDASVISSE